MDERYLQIREYTGEGFLPVVAFGTWRVAVLNTAARFRRENLTQAERHLETDEVFLLLKGAARLYIGDGGENSVGTLTAVPMEPRKVYNVPRNVWHAVETADDTSLLIVENSDTTADNSRKLPIPPGGLPL